jgi:hypothetical protein
MHHLEYTRDLWSECDQYLTIFPAHYDWYLEDTRDPWREPGLSRPCEYDQYLTIFPAKICVISVLASLLQGM